MTTAEIEKLYIEHADDFRTLLGHDGSMTHESVAIFEDGTKLFAPEHDDTEWHTLEDNPSPALAVAAMAGAWPERLAKEFHVVLRPGEVAGRVEWDTGKCIRNFPSIHHAICAAVKARAAEKRDNADHTPDANKKVEASRPPAAQIVDDLEQGAFGKSHSDIHHALAERIDEHEERFTAFLKYASEVVSTWPKWKQQVFGKSGAE